MTNLDRVTTATRCCLSSSFHPDGVDREPDRRMQRGGGGRSVVAGEPISTVARNDAERSVRRDARDYRHREVGDIEITLEVRSDSIGESNRRVEGREGQSRESERCSRNGGNNLSS